MPPDGFHSSCRRGNAWPVLTGLLGAARLLHACGPQIVPVDSIVYAFDRSRQELSSRTADGRFLARLDLTPLALPQAACPGPSGTLALLDSRKPARILLLDARLSILSSRPLPEGPSRQILSGSCLARDALRGFSLVTAHPPRLWLLGDLEASVPPPMELPWTPASMTASAQGPTLVSPSSDTLRLDWNGSPLDSSW